MHRLSEKGQRVKHGKRDCQVARKKEKNGERRPKSRKKKKERETIYKKKEVELRSRSKKGNTASEGWEEKHEKRGEQS